MIICSEIPTYIQQHILFKKKAAKSIILVINFMKLRKILKVKEQLSYQTTKVKMKIVHKQMKSSPRGQSQSRKRPFYTDMEKCHLPMVVMTVMAK